MENYVFETTKNFQDPKCYMSLNINLSEIHSVCVWKYSSNNFFELLNLKAKPWHIDDLNPGRKLLRLWVTTIIAVTDPPTGRIWVHFISKRCPMFTGFYKIKGIPHLWSDFAVLNANKWGWYVEIKSSLNWVIFSVLISKVERMDEKCYTWRTCYRRRHSKL